MRLTVIFSLLVIPLTVHALLPNAAGPRLGTVSIIEIQVAGPQAIDALVHSNYDISNVRGNTVTIYATPEELREIEQLGYAYTVVGTQPSPPVKVATGYHDYDSLTSDLNAMAAAHTSICRLASLGKSVQGRDLWVCLITHDPDQKKDKPAVKYLSTIHGDEPVGTENCLDFINELLSNDGTDTRVTNLLENEAVWIVPLVNPDGLELGQRYNANGIDLNRSFPMYATDFTGNILTESLVASGRQPEVAAIMNWVAQHTFVISANFHTGSLVVNYPYDDGYDSNGHEIASGSYAQCPDDLLFQDLSRRYSIHNTPMWNSPDFQDGITNGSAWYSITGGMQDWGYRFALCDEVTIELSDTIKEPDASALTGLWNDNEDSMFSYLEAAEIGIRGIVTDKKSGQPLRAEVIVENNAQPVMSDPDVGNYQRLLLPGTYTLHFSAPLHIPRVQKNILVNEGPATRADIVLASADIDGDGKVTASDIQWVIRKILGFDVPYDCDLDSDGQVTAADLQLLVNYVLGEL